MQSTAGRRRFIIGLTALVAWPLKMFGEAARTLRGDEIKSSNETDVSRLAELSAPSGLIACSMIYHCIRYTIDPHKLDDFEAYARKWMDGDIIRRCGGKPIGYCSPRKVWAVRITLLLPSSDLKAWPITKTIAVN